MAAIVRNVLSKRLTLKTKCFGTAESTRAENSLKYVQKYSKYLCSPLPSLVHRKQSSISMRDPSLKNGLLPRRSCLLELAQFCEHSSHADRNCWKCGTGNSSYEELFFCKCGIVQKLPDKLTYFEMLNSDQQFDIDMEQLSRIYKDLQSRLHPDKFTLKSKDEQDLAEKQSAFINKAYFTLLKPMSRGLYLLELWGDPLEESTSILDQEFLMEMMEINEDVDAARSDLKELKAIEDMINERMEDCVKRVSDHFRKKEISDAKLNLIQLKYFTNISDKVKEIYRDMM